MTTSAFIQSLNDEALERYVYSRPDDLDGVREVCRRALDRGFLPHADVETVLAQAEDDHNDVERREAEIKDLEEVNASLEADIETRDAKIAELQAVIEDAGLDLV